MGKDYNHVGMVGRLVRDAELIKSKSGISIGKFSIATNDIRKVGNNWEEEVSFIDCVCFGNTADNLVRYLTKGKQVAIDAKIKQNRWQQDGQSRSRIELIVNTIQLLGGGRDSNTQNEHFSTVSEKETDKLSDDIPF